MIFTQNSLVNYDLKFPFYMI
uniref:Uncharacterized protein n=1 Tax=Rhizophora mucronata TaxID=61149 RepID=A0A2P2IPM6_RHIMU